MPDVPLLLLAIVGVALVFDYTNGAHDSANAIATIVSTKVLSPLQAVGMAAVLDFAGALLGTEVAHTIGSGIVSPSMIAGCHTLVRPEAQEPEHWPEHVSEMEDEQGVKLTADERQHIVRYLMVASAIPVVPKD